VPLSEEELRLLEQMERALVQEDPKLASTLRGAALVRAARRRAILAGTGFVLGVCLLLAGVIVSPPLGVVGFVLMLATAYVAVEAIRSIEHGPQPSFKSRFEARMGRRKNW
jgi:hypothetical protein